MSTSTLRAAPIRLTPLPGEALDSWLETLCARLATPLGHLRGHLGLGWRTGRRDGHGPAPDWTAHLTPAETEHLAATTGLAPAAVTAMTLSRWHGHATSIDTATRTVNYRHRSFWSRPRGSRYCPACLAHTGGRWQLAWRLTWHFACLEHGRLLGEHCGGCGGLTRESSHPLHMLPTPGTCGLAHPASSSRETHRVRCGFRLANCVPSAATGPLLATQRLIAETIDNQNRPVALGIYRAAPVSTAQFLADLRTLSTMIFRIPNPDEELARWATPGMLARYHAELRRDVAHKSAPVTRREYLTPVDAAATGLVLTAALDVLTAPDLPTAADRLQWINESLRTVQPLALAPHRLARNGVSPPLQTAVIHAREPHMPVARRLKHRITGAATPCQTASHTPANRAACLPALLWPRIAVPLIPPEDRGARLWRLALPVCIMLIGQTSTTVEAAALLGHASHIRSAVTRTHAKIRLHPAAAATLRALTLLADELERHGCPIDYTRRRTLFAHRTEFITLDQWSALRVRRSDSPTRTLLHAQRWLYETLTGNPIEAAPGPLAIDDYRSRTRYTEFRTRLLPAEARLLHNIGGDHLERLDIDEPLTYQPNVRFPTDLLTALPGRDPDDIDVATVHQLFLSNDRNTANKIAVAIGTSSEHVRSTLDDNPVPRHIVPSTPDPRRRPS